MSHCQKVNEKNFAFSEYELYPEIFSFFKICKDAQKVPYELKELKELLVKVYNRQNIVHQINFTLLRILTKFHESFPFCQRIFFVSIVYLTLVLKMVFQFFVSLKSLNRNIIKFLLINVYVSG